MIVSRPYLVAIGIAAVLLVNSQLPADDRVDVDIAKLYEEFNAALRQVGSDDDALSRFYTKAHRAANRCAFFDSNCRMSGRIFNKIITLTKYEIVSTENLVDGSVDLMVSGNNAEGAGIGLIVKWLFEEGRWRIDLIAKVPNDWVELKRRFPTEKLITPKDFIELERRLSTEKPRPKPITPRD